MIGAFTTNPTFTTDNFYDCGAYRQSNPQDFPCVSATSDELEALAFSGQQQSLLQEVSSYKLDDWAGCAVDSRSLLQNKLLEVFPQIAHNIKKDKELVKFYLP